MHNSSQDSPGNAQNLRMIDYNQHSEVQALAAKELSKLIEKYAAKLAEELPSNETIQICEYGCATGGSSIAPIRAIKNAMGRRKLILLMNDLPMNDWKNLKKTVETEFSDINFKYIAKSMYTPITDNASTHLGYSCFAQHWLDNGAPTGLPGDALWSNQLPKTSLERQAWETASRKDWERKLLLRANEIVSGGRLIIHIHSATNSGALSEIFAATLQTAKRLMIAKGELSDEQVDAMHIPQHCKSPAEIFNRLCTHQISSLWQLEEAHYYQLSCDHIFQHNRVERQIDFLKSFMNSTLMATLNADQLARFWEHVSELAYDNDAALSSNGMSTFLSLKRL